MEEPGGVVEWHGAAPPPSVVSRSLTWGEMRRQGIDVLERHLGATDSRRDVPLRRYQLDVAIGPDTTVTVAQFLRLAEVVRSVCLVRSKAGTGTGFLIQEDLLITNNHVFSGRQYVLADAATARGSVAVFDYDEDPLDERSVQVHELDPDAGFVASTDLDFAVCRVKSVSGDQPKRESLALTASVRVAKGDDVFIIQHPRGRAKRIGQSGNMVTFDDQRIVQYTTDTDEGSSGAPVFDYLWRLTALHHARQALKADGITYYRNEGYAIPAIDELLRSLGAVDQ